ncbi:MULTISPECIES: hypothetical protein [unclassified Novosphingobium]|uniref:hypothetical protein n=1 Tax=unclassified Novosphingobium TaxID=2644732 RepID=UPI00135678B5|nr:MULTISPECIES: hypothetical protein [unclassified Novosphingobium]
MALLAPLPSISASSTCAGTNLTGIPGNGKTLILSDGSLAGKAKVNINIDGYGRAYHPQNAAAGALIHLCNAGQVHLPDGRSYHGSLDNSTCTERFMTDVAKARVAGWTNPNVALVRWYGILGRGKGVIARRTVKNIVPFLQADGSGFYVSPTALADETIADPAVQTRYVNPLRIPAAVIPKSDALRSRGVVMGSFGVAWDPAAKRAVPFVVGDYGPAIGEASPALARSLAGLPITDHVTRANRYAGQVDAARIVWVFFGKAGGRTKYDSGNEQLLVTGAMQAFQAWGGRDRLLTCFP